MSYEPADFAVEWEPVQPSRAQWAVCTHGPSGRVVRIKAAWCVRKDWTGDADALAWALPTAADVLWNQDNPPPAPPEPGDELIAALEAALAAALAEADAADGEL